MSIKGRHGDNVKILRPYEPRRESHAELANVALLDDAARRIARSGHVLYPYYSQLDSLREAAKDVGNTVLAERSSRAELHTRLILSAGLDALNELQDLGVLQQSLRGAIAEPSAVNRTTLEEVVDHCSGMLRHRYPEESWKWLAESKRMFSGVTVQFEPDDGVLRVTVMSGGQPIPLILTPDGGQRIDTAAFFGVGPGSNRVTRAAEPVLKLSLARSKDGEAARSAYDAAVDGLAFARESVYRHARNAVELGAPGRSGAGPAAVLIVLAVAGALIVTVGVIEAYICRKDHDETACKWADILLPFGTALLGAAGKKDDLDPNTGTARTRLQFGTNR